MTWRGSTVPRICSRIGWASGPYCARMQDQVGDCRDQAYAKPHDIFCVLVEIMLRQSATKQRAEKDAAEGQYEYDGRQS